MPDINVFFDFGGPGRYHYAAFEAGRAPPGTDPSGIHGMSAAKSLDALRREIDRIDTEIHDLIQRRTEVVEAVRDLKEGDAVKIRPAREDEIAYRLVASHTGNFPKRELLRIWRELIVATLSFEGPFSVAVYEDEPGKGCWDLARDMYGTYTPMMIFPSARRVIEAVRDHAVTVGILPLPRKDDDEPWWPHLMAEGDDAPRVIARLPFAGPGNSRGAHVEALAICPVSREPTGRDRSLLAIETEVEAGESGIAAAFTAAGIPPHQVCSWREPGSRGPWLYLAELEGFVTPEDRGIERFIDALNVLVSRVVGIGAYGVPLTAEELAPVPAKKKTPAAKNPRKPTRKSTPSSRKRRL